MVTIRTDARSSAVDVTCRIPGSRRRTEPDTTSCDRSDATAGGERAGCAGAVHRDHAVRARPGQLFERVGCPSAGPRSAHHGGPNKNPAGAGGGVPDPRVKRRLDCATIAKRKPDPPSWRARSVRTLKTSPNTRHAT